MNIFKNSSLLFSIFIILGIIYPKYSNTLNSYLIPLLIILMTFSITNIHFGHINKNNIRHILKLLFMNYILLGSLIIILTLIFVKDLEFQKGLIILGAMPPAVGIISISVILKGNIKEAIATEIIGYLISLFLTPFIIFIIYGNAITPQLILTTLIQIILIPLLLSRILTYISQKTIKKDIPYTTEIVNICYGLSFYIIIGINQKIILPNIIPLISIGLLLIFTKFIVGEIIIKSTQTHKTKHKEAVLYTLFSTFKNGSMGMAIALMLFGQNATLPFAVNAILTPPFIIYLEYKLKQINYT
jgi:bile acid:Na+ symporter, BASS family